MFRRYKSMIFLLFVFFSLFNINNKVYADEELQTTYQAFFPLESEKFAWSDEVGDNTKLYFKNTYPSAIKIGLINQPSNMSGTILYEVNSSGKGWLSAVENREELGVADANANPLEAIKLYLNGDLAKNYDVYYRVLQDGEFGQWYKNGEIAGRYGEGKHISGLVVTIVKKGEEPKESKDLPINNDIRDIDPDKPMIALSYDDGPSSRLTPILLDILKQNNAKATFFLIGNRIPSTRKIVERMYLEGNEIGNHTWAHKYLPRQSEAERINAIEMTNNLIKEIIGKRPNLVRAPGGFIDRNTADTFTHLNMSSILWSIDTLDWKHRNVEATINAVLSNIKDGDIVLMHDIHTQTIQASQRLIPELVKRGYQLVTISELANYRGGLGLKKNYHSFRK